MSIDHPTQRVIPASGAAPVATSAASSVFALGQASGATADRAAMPPTTAKPKRARKNAGELAALADRVVKTVEACGTITSVQLAEVLGSCRPYALKQLKALERAGRLVAQQDGLVQVFALAHSDASTAARPSAAPAARGFKGYLARKASQEGAPPITTPTPRATELRIGLFNDGELVLEHKGVSMRLDAAAARELVGWLSHVGTVGGRVT